MGERRVAYVRARFADIGEFGTEDIEDWLECQRVSPVPAAGWESFLSCPTILDAARQCEVEVLRRNADPVPVTAQTPGLVRGLRTLLAALDPYKASVYLGQSFGPVILFPHGSKPPSMRIEQEKEEGHFSFSTLESVHVIDVLFTTWKNRGAKYEAARKFLCDAFAEEIGRVRIRAEYDFDTSVAVSDDGTRVVQADWVVLFEEVRGVARAYRYPAEAFMLDKLEADLGCIDREEIGLAETSGDFFHTLKQGQTSAQTLILSCLEVRVAQERIFLTGDEQGIFMSHRRFFRGPQPQNGEAISR
jgi:hypothetical protein